MDRKEQRYRMVEDQLVARGIRDRAVIEVFKDVPRHVFVDDEHSASAYEDHPLPIGFGQTISQPYMVALMTESIRIKGGEKILEIGTGSGYQAAILARLAGEVCTVERDPRLLERARGILNDEGFSNIKFRCGDGTLGWREEAPYDGIIVTAAAPDIPHGLLDQLADGGRLIIPVGPRYAQTLIMVQKHGDEFEPRNICGCVFVPLIGEDGWRDPGI